jgi:uncharacterized protein (TIGR02246 family)
LEAVERGDGEEIASFWTADGDYVDGTGQAVNGRDLARQVTRSEKTTGSRRVVGKEESLRFLTPDVAVEDGAVSLSPATAGRSVVKRYTAIWSREDGKWLLDGVRESSVSPWSDHHHHLSELSWMLGDWVANDDAKSIRLTCTWSDDKRFLLRELDVSLPERGRLHVTQRIGWDAREKQIRSWTFDSQGGHGGGLWFRQGDRWIVEAESILPDGGRSTGTNIYTPDGDDAFDWEASNVEIDGQAMPDHSARMVRQKASD